MPRPSINRGFPDAFLTAVLVMASVLAFAIGVMSDARGALIGDFDLTSGTFDNAVPSSPIAGIMTGQVSGGTGNFTVDGWSWSGATTPGSGLRLEGLPATANGTFSQYTIAIEFAYGVVGPAQYRLMWLTSGDDGLYVNNSKFAMYGYPVTDNGTLTANQTTNFVVARAGNGTVTAYQVLNPEAPNPTVNQLFTFLDSSGILVSSNGTMEFFRDNGTPPSEFSTSGTASLIKLWDVPLTADEVKFAFVPEPATIALLAVAGGGAMLYLHRRRRSQR
jgi:hypothetical protein